MVNRMKFYIDGAWVDPVVIKMVPVVNPATEERMYDVAVGSKADVDKAVAAARRAFETFSVTTREERIALLERIIDAYKARSKEIAAAISDEMGAPIPMAERAQAGAGLGHLMSTLQVLKDYHFEEKVGSAVVVREPVGVIGMITPWNWPLNQIACKVAPAIAAGCTMLLKPSEFTPTSALIFAEVMHAAGVPKGVFNLVNGLGPEVGVAMSEHPGIDMISFTGSTRAGIDVAQRAAHTVKRVSQELGGKSPNIILEDADMQKAVTGGVAHVFNNSGQSCNAPTRMLVPQSRMEELAIDFQRLRHAVKNDELIDQIPTRAIADEILVGWSGIFEADNTTQIPYSEESKAQLLEVATVAEMLVQTYIESIEKAKAKN